MHSNRLLLSVARSGCLASTLTWLLPPLKNFEYSEAKASQNPFPLAIINDCLMPKRQQPFKGIHLLQIPSANQEWYLQQLAWF